jgi:hypothetical protein
MKYRVDKIETVKGSSLLYVEVAFLDDAEKLLHQNDFVMQIAARQGQYTRWLDTGKTTLNGRPILQPDPTSYQETDTDVAAMIQQNIKAYIERTDVAKAKADNRDRSIPTEDSDPAGLRAAPGVAQLVGSVKTAVGGTG